MLKSKSRRFLCQLWKKKPNGMEWKWKWNGMGDGKRTHSKVESNSHVFSNFPTF